MPGPSFLPPAPRPQRGVALSPFSAEAPNELSVRPGDVLLAYYRVDTRWIYVRKEGTRQAGYVPFLYCRLAPNVAPTSPRHADDTSSVSSLASLSDPGLPSPTSSTSSCPNAELRPGGGSWAGPLLRPPSLQDSFDSGVSSLRSSGRGSSSNAGPPSSATLPPPPRPPKPSGRSPRAPAASSTCLRGSPASRGVKKKQVTFSSSAPQVFLTPKYVLGAAESSEDIVDLDELMSQAVTSPLPPPPPPPPEMELYETFVSAVDDNGDIETVTLV